MQFFERFSDRILQWTRAASIQRKIDMFESADEIEDVATREWSAGRRAKMCPASERSRFVNQAIACFLLEHWTRAISIVRERFSAGSAQTFRREERFAFRQIRSAPGQFEMTTLGFAHAVALDRASRKIDINLSHLGKRGLHVIWTKVLAIHAEVRSAPAMACPAIHPVVQAA
jgi:hypothetical protein